MTFKIMALLTTIAGSILGLRFIFAGASVLKQWGVEATDGTQVICRRYGAIYLGLALMFFLGRKAAPSDLRSAICLGIGGAIALLACLGLFELRAGRVNSGIIGPALAESVLAAGFMLGVVVRAMTPHWFSGRGRCFLSGLESSAASSPAPRCGAI